MTPSAREIFGDERYRTYLLHSHLAGFRRKIERSLSIIRDALAQCQNPYVAWSGGKDSTAMLDLVMHVRPGIPALCVQSDLDLPDDIEVVRDGAERMGVNLTLIHPAVSGWDVLRECGGPFGQVNVAASKLDRLCFFEPLEREVNARGYDLAFLGLRAGESRARLMNRRVRGVIYANKSRGISVCTPIADWSGMDVYAYLASRALPINAVYGKDKFHPDPSRIREGWWIPGETTSMLGGVVWLRHYYPELYRRLAAEYPEVASRV